MQEKKSSFAALLPIAIFLVIYIGGGILFQDFYAMPAIVVFLIALAVAFLQNRGLKFNEKMHLIAEELSDDNIITMCLIFLLAGAFTGAATAAGGVDSTVNLGLTLLPGGLAVVGLFVIGCFISTSMGTSVGTISALAPIAVGISEKTGFAMALCLGAVVSGAMFGDNLSMISDTTIAATKTQGVALKDKFRVNFYIALPAALITLVILLIIGRGGGAVLEPRSFDILKVVPYVLVLTLAILGVNVFLTLTLGIFSAGIIGLCAGDLTIFTFAQDIWNGFTGMSEVFFLALFCGGISELIAHNGGIVWLIEKLRKMMHGGKSAQIGMSVLVSLADCATANNTVAIILCGSVAKDMSREFKVDPRRTASLLDVFSCVFQGIIPYGAQLLVAASLTTTTYGIVISPVEIVPYMWYCWILAGFGLLSIFVPYADRTCRRDPWNWEYDVAESGVEAKKALLEKSRER